MLIDGKVDANPPDDARDEQTAEKTTKENEEDQYQLHFRQFDGNLGAKRFFVILQATKIHSKRFVHDFSFACLLNIF